MNLLAAALYDPSTAVVNKATTAAIALTAFDTTNLRLTVTAPPSGRLWIVIICTIHGATTCPQIILGCLEGSTVRGRVTPEITVSNLAATSLYRARAEYCLTGLTPGQSYVLDAAYGVETVVASTNIKYGGPNNTTANDNFGAFQFEIWDPSPSYTPAANGVPPTSTVHVKIDAVQADTDNIQTRIPAALVSGRMDSSVGAMAADTLTAAAAAADFGAEIGTAVWATGTRALTDKSGFALTQAFPTNFAALAITAGGAVTAGTVSDKAGYSLTTAPLDAAGTRAAVGLAAANLDTQIGALLTSAAYTAPDNASITAIKAKTDSLAFTVAGKLDVNLLVVNGVTVGGAGTAGDPWGPA